MAHDGAKLEPLPALAAAASTYLFFVLFRSPRCPGLRGIAEKPSGML